MKLKKIVFATILMAILTTNGISQIQLSVTGAVSPESTPRQAGVFINRHQPSEEFAFNLSKSGLQYFAGIKAELALDAPFFIDAGLLYNRQSSTYHMEYTLIDAEHPVSNHFMQEKEERIVFPVNIGLSLGPFDITSGMRTNYLIRTSSDLQQVEGYTQENHPIHFGWQLGVGFNIWKTKVGIEYQSESSRVGKGKSIHNESLELNHIPGGFAFCIQQNL